MKKYIALLLAASIISGCSTNGEDGKKEIKAAEEGRTKEKNTTANDYSANPQVTDDRTLTKAGDTITDRKGDLTLRAVKKVDKSINIGGIHYKINEVKLLHFVPDYSLIDFYHPFTHDEEFNFVKVEIEMENNAEEGYHFAPVAMMNINGSIHKTWEDDFYLEELNGEISPGQVKKGNIGFIVDELDNLDKIDIMTGDLVGMDKEKKAEPVKLTIELES